MSEHHDAISYISAYLTDGDPNMSTHILKEISWLLINLSCVSQDVIAGHGSEKLNAFFGKDGPLLYNLVCGIQNTNHRIESLNR
jgi:hypothetical protein